MPVHAAHLRRGGAEGACDIAQRTRVALQAAKARCRQLGDREIGRRKTAAADAFAEGLRETVTPLAGQTMRAIAKALDEAGIKTARGG